MPTNLPPADDFDDDFDEIDPFSDEETPAINTHLTPEQIAEIERRMNINRLKSEALKLSNGQMTTFESSETPSEITEQCGNMS